MQEKKVCVQDLANGDQNAFNAAIVNSVECDNSCRGADFGRYGVFLGIAEALAIFIGGFLAGKFGFKMVFCIVSLIFIITTTIMLKLKE